MLSRDQNAVAIQDTHIPASLSGGQRHLDTLAHRAPADLGGDRGVLDARPNGVAASVQAVSNPTPGCNAPAPELSRDQAGSDAHRTCVPVDFNGGQETTAVQMRSASANVNGDHPVPDAHRGLVPADALLKLYADLVDDLERVRIATENRRRSLIQVKGLEGSPEEERLGDMAESLHKIERAAIRDLEKQMTAHPLGRFAEQNTGVGLKSLARLLGTVGDPCSYVDRETGEVIERTVSKLWAYCGYKPGQGKYKGQEHNYSRIAKTRTYLIAESCMKNRKSPYRPVYEAARAKYEERDLPDWRKNSMALRVVSKEILKDLWKFRRGHMNGDTRVFAAPPSDLGRGHHELDALIVDASANGKETA